LPGANLTGLMHKLSRYGAALQRLAETLFERVFSPVLEFSTERC